MSSTVETRARAWTVDARVGSTTTTGDSDGTRVTRYALHRPRDDADDVLFDRFDGEYYYFYDDGEEEERVERDWGRGRGGAGRRRGTRARGRARGRTTGGALKSSRTSTKTRVRCGWCACAASLGGCEKYAALAPHPTRALGECLDVCAPCHTFLSTGSWGRDETTGQFLQCQLCGQGGEERVAYLCDACSVNVLCVQCAPILGAEKHEALKRNPDETFVCLACDSTPIKYWRDPKSRASPCGQPRVIQIDGKPSTKSIRTVSVVGRRQQPGQGNEFLCQVTTCCGRSECQVESEWVSESALMDTEMQQAITDYTQLRMQWKHRGGTIKAEKVLTKGWLNTYEYVHANGRPTDGDIIPFGVNVMEGALTDDEIHEAERGILELTRKALQGDLGGDPFVTKAGTTSRIKLFFGFAYEKRSDSRNKPQRLIKNVPGIDDPLAAPLHKLAKTLQKRGVFAPDFVPNQYVLNIYGRAGAYLMAHKDALHLFEGPIYGVRLFNPRILSFAPDGHMRINVDRGMIDVMQSVGSVTSMDGFAKEDVQHSIPRLSGVDPDYFSCSVIFRMAKRDAVRSAIETLPV